MRTKPNPAVQKFWDSAREFLNVYLPQVRNVSPNTVDAYRQSLNHFIRFLESEKSVSRKILTFDCFCRQHFKDYMLWMKDVKGLAPKTCNLRMTAIRSFLEFCFDDDITLGSAFTASRTIKNMRAENSGIKYLTKSAMKAILEAPDTKNRIGKRDKTLLIFMYDTAARVQEMTDLRLRDLHLNEKKPFVSIKGKGSKTRNVPLMNKTLEHLRLYLAEFHPGQWMGDEPLFYTRKNGQPYKLSTDAISWLLSKYVIRARLSCPDIPDKVHCHLIRKTRAMDLYQEGIPLVYIAQLLGHENVSTTSGFYAFATVETLHKSMAKANPAAVYDAPQWKSADTMEQLYRL